MNGLFKNEELCVQNDEFCRAEAVWQRKKFPAFNAKVLVFQYTNPRF